LNRERFRKLDPAGTSGRGDAWRLIAVREREEERWRRARSIGIIGTVLLHLALLLLFRQAAVPAQSTAAAGPARGDVRASAGGGSGMTMVEIRPESRLPEEVQQPVPVPAQLPDLPREIIVATPAPAPSPAPALTPPASLPGTGAPGTGGDEGLAEGPGSGTGTGTGDGGGGGDDGGGVARIVPPTPRGVFIPPAGRPNSARGQEITVWVFVTEAGRVQRSSVRLEPPTSDSRYNQRLIQSVSEWVFDPARQGGRAIPVWYPFQIIL